jgi:hypothetical protein
MANFDAIERRQFVAGVLGVGSTFVLGAGTAFGGPLVCRSPKPFRPGSDKRPIAERRTVEALAANPVWKAQMLKGYAAMRAFHPNDPRSLNQQGNLHNVMCSGGAIEVHQSDRFLAWHRCFLYFQERIVSSNIHYSGSGAPTPKPPDPKFRLAVWDWEATSTPLFPSAFTTGSLHDPRRHSAYYANEGNILPALSVPATNPFEFYGYPVGGAGGSPVLENGPHGAIHMSTGLQTAPYKDMGNLSTAALDPVFCAHHGNIDRVWACWQDAHNNVTPNSIDPSTSSPFDAAWIHNTWRFTDWDGQCYSITPASIIDYKQNLRYTYPDCGKRREPRRLVISVSGSRLQSAEAGGEAASLILNDLQIPAPGYGRFVVIASINGESRPVGRFALFGHPMAMVMRRSVLATLSPEGVAALRTGASFAVAPEPADSGGLDIQVVRVTGGAPLKVTAATLVAL